MKTTLLLLSVIAALATSSFAIPPEEKLAKLQIEEASAARKYRDESPRIVELKAQIESLFEIPNIRNQKYYSFMKSELIRLTIDRDAAAKKYSSNSSIVRDLDTRVAFIQGLLNKNAG